MCSWNSLQAAMAYGLTRRDSLGRHRRVLTPPSGKKIYYNPYSLDRRVFGFGLRARLKSLLARPLADFEGTCKAPPFK